MHTRISWSRRFVTALAMLTMGLSMTALASPALATNTNTECTTLSGVALRDALKTAGSGVDNPQVADGSTAVQWHATLVVPEGSCDVQASFSSYDLPGGMIHPFDAQVLFDNVTGMYGPGTHGISVNLPSCRWQVDLYTGDVIAHLNATYGHPADRLIDWTYNQGAVCDEESQSPSATPTRSPKETPKETPKEDHAALNIKKVDGNGKPLAGAIFTVEGMEGTFTTGDNGKFCITGLPADAHWLVTEIQAPAGYEIADPASQMVEVDDDGDCNSPDARFVNLPKESSSKSPEQSVKPSQSASPTSTPASHTPEESVKGGQGGPSGGGLPDTSTTGGGWTAAWGAVLLLSAMVLVSARRRAQARTR